MEGLAGGGLIFAAAPGLPPAARTGPGPRTPKYLLVGVFSGGWDQLLALDPRDHRRPEFQPDRAYSAQGSGIHPAYDRLTDPETRTLLETVPSGVQTVTGSPLTFGPAVPRSLLAHAADFSIVRGIDMGTLTHEVGRDAFLTGWLDLASPQPPELAARVLIDGAASAVIVELASGLDDHDGQWAGAHAPQLRSGFDSLARLVAQLKTAPDLDGGSCWDHTTLLCVSDLARTPLLNGRGGRDHHAVSSCLVGGAGVRAKRVVGGSSDAGMVATRTIRPSDIVATLLRATGLADPRSTRPSGQVLQELLRA